MPEGLRHPAVDKGCSRIQVAAFERIATGDVEGHAPATLQALERRGLITLQEVVLAGSVPVKVRVPVVPIAVHYAWCAWCAWCAEQPEPG